jgi:hypothetical protein
MFRFVNLIQKLLRNLSSATTKQFVYKWDKVFDIWDAAKPEPPKKKKEFYKRTFSLGGPNDPIGRGKYINISWQQPKRSFSF